jgi:ABC-type antimicrobial peptide transport system permease subunit
LAALALLLVGVLAGLIPALRAASLDPVKALRTE